MTNAYRLGDFVLGDSSLGLVLGNLYPLLRQSLAWFKLVRGVLRLESMGSKVRSSDLETSLSSSASTAGAEMDTTTSVPSSVPSSSHPFVSVTPRTFHTPKEKCYFKVDTFSRFRDKFQFPKKTRFVSLGRVKRHVPSLMVMFVFIRLRSCAALDFLSTRS